MGLPPQETLSPLREESAAAPQPVKRRLYVLDGLRLIAALMVVFYHYTGYNPTNYWGRSDAAVFPAIHGITSYGWLGVYLFFLISGFVICMSSWNRTPRQFLFSRFTRLYPAYWAAVILTSAVVFLTPKAGRLSPPETLANLTMFERGMGVPYVDGVYWTLWAELRFYMLFAVVVAFGVTYRRVMTFCVIWMAACIMTTSGDNDFLNQVFEPTYAPFFIGGIGIFLMYRFGPRPEIWLLIAASWLDGQFQLDDLSDTAEGHARTPVYWAVCVILLALFYAVLIAVARGRLEFLNWRWLTVAGAMTYPLYLIHEKIGLEIILHNHNALPPYLLLGLLVGGALLSAYLIHRLVEEPVARRLRKWLATPWPAIPSDRASEPPTAVPASAQLPASATSPDFAAKVPAATRR
ncbi:acyltransferase family protein [Actinacidiphila alni]|uniref:acyltransferase family protein n=1 Tax=Actinacidiphila alni TaxID=380248 RepID=UPI0034533C2C